MMAQRRVATIAAAATASAVALGCLYYWYSRSRAKAAAKPLKEVIDAIEALVQRDEGGRGIGQIILPGELYNAAKELVGANTVAILTGFPCLMDYSPPTETDGPLGAFAVARALIRLGKKAIIITDECNAECILACAANAGLDGTHLQLESFPPGEEWTGREDTRLLELAEEVDMVVAIERTGPAHDGTYRTMRAFDMTKIVAPLERILTAGSKPMRSIGIGDGGNELGMGKVLDKILQSNIPNAHAIACVEATSHLIVSSVSNWGGYALAGAVALFASEDPRLRHRFHDRQAALRMCLPTDEEELEMSQRLIAAGARCGITKKCDEPYVDGMPIAESIRVIHDIIKAGSQ